MGRASGLTYIVSGSDFGLGPIQILVGRLDEMLHEFAVMKEVGMVLGIVSYNTVINSSQKVGRLDFSNVVNLYHVSLWAVRELEEFYFSLISREEKFSHIQTGFWEKPKKFL